MSRTPLLDQEIWRLKNEDLKIRPKKKNTVPPNLIDTPIDQRNFKDERIFRLASESAAEEFEMEFNSLLKEFQDWKKTHEGTFKDFLKSNKDDVKVIKISKILANRKVADATDAQQEEAKRLWQLELKKMELDPYYIPDLIDPEEIEIKSAKDGGLIDKRNKPKEPAGVKKIDLMGDFYNLMDMVAKMSPEQRRSIQWLLDKTFGKKK